MRKKPVTVSAPRIFFLVVVLLLFSLVPFSLTSLPSANAAPPPPPTAISPTPAGAGGLRTIVTPGSVPTGLCSGNCVITGGTRPGGGTNLFHSFGQFNVGSGDITTFQNGISFNANGTPFIAGLATSNILARITGTNGNNPSLSTIYGTIRTAADFGNANLFLMNPAGFLFGPNATVNVGGMMTFTTADYIKLTDGGRFNANPNTLPADILTAYPVSAFGFLDPTVAPIAPITVYGMTVQGPMPTDPDTGAPLGQKVALVGGNITFTSDPESGTPSTVAAPGRQIQITSVAGKGEVAAGSLMPAAGMVLGTVTLDPGTFISTAGDPSFGNGSGGSISIRGGQFVATGATIITSPYTDFVSFSSTGSAGDLIVNVTGTATIADSLIQTNSLDAGNAGAVSLAAKTDLMLTNSNINSTSISDSGTVGALGNGGAITLTAEEGILFITNSTIGTVASNAGNAGAVTITGKDVTFNRAGIFADVDASGFDVISDPALGQVHPGAVTVTAENTVTFSGSFSDDPGTPVISAQAFQTLVDAGRVTITGKTVNLSNGTIDVTMFSDRIISPGNGGAIEILGNNVNLTQFYLFSRAEGVAESTGGGGSILLRGADSIHADNIQLTASRLDASANSGGGGGNIEIQSKLLTVSDHTDVATDSGGQGSGGMITVRGAEDVTIESGSTMITDVVVSLPGVSQGTAGNILIETQNLTLQGGGQIRAGAEPLSTGNAANITVQGTSSPAESVLIDGPGSGIFTDTQGTGAGGNIFVNANSVTLQNGGALSAATSGTAATATGGTITVHANQVQLNNGGLITASTTGAGDGGSITIGAGSTFVSNASTVSSTATQAQGGDIAITAGQSVTLNNGSSISASSTGLGNAGNILINAGQNYTSTNSAVTTQAAQASGGNITVLATDRVQLTNSQLNASVEGSLRTVGGNITIDPLYVILLNSQILAQATQGQGGAISINITNGGLYLPDANSTVSASSKFGVNGTVTIQSPNAPASGKIQPLGKSPLLATSLLNQRCASLAGGEFSSFTVAGRDSLPTEPGSWLTSPLYAAGMGTGEGLSGLSSLSGVSGVVRGGLAAHQIDQTDQTDQSLLSLRQIAPAGFLTQTFAVDWSASCQS